MSGAHTIRGVIFDLDGVLVSTDELHFEAWKELATREGIAFTREDNHRLRGVDRMRSLEIILERAHRAYSDSERASMAAEKNKRYRELLGRLTPNDTLSGARETITNLRLAGVHTAVGSSSRNAREIIRKVELTDLLDAIIDGNDISRSKPDPQVFQKAADALGLRPDQCVVIEDAEAGVQAALAGGFRVVAVGHHTGFDKDARVGWIADLAGGSLLRALGVRVSPPDQA